LKEVRRGKGGREENYDRIGLGRKNRKDWKERGE
jgi:hypothetical protein